jgi:hypothetical protein
MLRHYVEFRTMPSRSKNYRSIRPSPPLDSA